MEVLKPVANNKLAIWDLPIEILQDISCSLASKDHLQWALVSRWFSSVLCQRLVPNAVARHESYAFIWAFNTGHLDMMRQCIDLGMSPRLSVSFISAKECYERLPIVGASLLSGDADAAQLLMSRGAKLSDLPLKGPSKRRNPLYFVRHTATLRLLLQKSTRRYTNPCDSDGLFKDMIINSVPDEVLSLALENSVFPLNPRIVCEAISYGRISLVEKLFLMVPRLSSSDDEGRLFDGSPALWYIYSALGVLSSADDIHRMLQVINEATDALPPRSFNPVMKRILRAAMTSTLVSKDSLVWLMSNRLIDLSSKENRRAFHEAVYEIASGLRWLNSFTINEKMKVLLEYDSTIALYLPIGNISYGSNIAYPRFLHAVEGKILDGEMAPEVRMTASQLLVKLLGCGTGEGTLHRTANVVERLVSLGASGSVFVKEHRSWRRTVYLTALIFACKITLDPQQGRRCILPRTEAYDMSTGSNKKITTYGEYLSLRRASIVQIIRALLPGGDILGIDADGFTGLDHVKFSGIYSDIPELLTPFKFKA
ncbi:hypothetical protein GCG54_00006853 [Colletotrichum gloeosporioides]|uniref:F-box domain-containing protein n=1 Tax=Colletotrichum gloeosporioides TaxID=474922 RepID=A0A8H4FN44_COLGL|nr:uncharacterized protein GCG54_00006853 [Colletotrichum gloeosporioides]KAF3808235.1 hypothetical protein GCG54_00006853 [Colletotrichum gloeosporioides]